MKICLVGTELFHADGWTDGWTGMTKLIVAFRSVMKKKRNRDLKAPDHVPFHTVSCHCNYWLWYVTWALHSEFTNLRTKSEVSTQHTFLPPRVVPSRIYCPIFLADPGDPAV